MYQIGNNQTSLDLIVIKFWKTFDLRKPSFIYGTKPFRVVNEPLQVKY